MSLAIEIDDVTHVLLADGWHTVADKSFNLDSYEFMWEEGLGKYDAIHGGGNSGVCATGFGFKENGFWHFGPLTAVLAVKTKAKA